MGSSKCIEHLPDELLVEIFSYLTFEDLTLSVQHVSPRWREVAQDDELWRYLSYSPERDVSDHQIVSVLEQTPKLQTFLLRRGVKSAVLNTLSQNCNVIKKLELYIYQRVSVMLLKNLVLKCPFLEYLSIPENILDKREFAELIGQCRNLKTIKLSGWRDSDKPLVLKPIADGCPSLQHIDLRNQMHTNKDLEYLLHKKKHQLLSLYVKWSSEQGKCTLPLLEVCTTLEKLHVDEYCEISIEAGFQALRKMNTVKSLTLLYFENANIHNMSSLFHKRAMAQLVELDISSYDSYEDILGNVIIKNCVLLQRFRLKRCYNLTDQSLENMHTLCRLQHLNLHGCSNITDHGVSLIAKCQKLRYLNLCSCDQLTEQSMKQLIKFSHLQVLKLNCCNVSGLPFHLIPTHLKQLVLLSVKYCEQMDSTALKLLGLQMPHLNIKVSLGYFSEEEEYESDPDVPVEVAPFLFQQIDDSRLGEINKIMSTDIQSIHP